MSVISRLRAAGFTVITRNQWTYNPDRYWKRSNTHPFDLPARYQFLHITVTPDTDTLAEGEAGMRQLEGYGYSNPKTVSYNWVVTNEGKIFEGQRLDTKGTHTVNDKNVPGFPYDLNRYGHAVALMQNVNDAVTDIQVRAVAAIFAAEQLEGVMKHGAPLYPHRKFAWKDCPGDKAVAEMDSIAWLINKWVADGLPGTSPSKDWFDMATEAELRTIVAEEIDKRIDPFAQRVEESIQDTARRDAEAKETFRATQLRIETLHALTRTKVDEVKDLHTEAPAE